MSNVICLPQARASEMQPDPPSSLALASAARTETLPMAMRAAVRGFLHLTEDSAITAELKIAPDGTVSLVLRGADAGA